MIENSVSILAIIIPLAFIIVIVIINNKQHKQAQNEVKQISNDLIQLNKKFDQEIMLINQKQQENLKQTNEDDKKVQKEVESIQKELIQIKQQYDKEMMLINQQFQDSQNEKNEKSTTLKNEINQILSDFKDKLNQEIQSINQKFIEISNQGQFLKIENQIQSLEKFCERLNENNSKTGMRQQSEQQDLQQTYEQIPPSQNHFEEYYIQTNLPKLLQNLQDNESKLIKLIETAQNKNLIITFDQDRLQRTQSFVYKLYEESSNQRAVDLQYKYFVRETFNFNEMANNYSLPFSSKVELKKHCTSYKPVRGDGNCFYTAFVYQFLEFVIISYNQKQYQQFIQHCFDEKIQMRIKINKHKSESVDEQLQKELLNEFIYRLQEIRNIENVEERRQIYEKQFAAFEKQNEQIDGCFYALASIFIRNYTNYAVEFHELKEQLFDRANLLIWEEECQSSTEIVMQSLQKKLNLNIKLVFIQKDNTILVNNYENNSKYNLILVLKPGHYGIGYFNPLPLPEEENNGNSEAFLEQINLETFKNQPELLTLNLIRFQIKMVDYLNQQSQNILKMRSVPIEEQNIY